MYFTARWLTFEHMVRDVQKVDTAISERRPALSARTLAACGLAVVMVIAPLTQVAFLLVVPWPLDGDHVRDVSAHADAYTAMAWLSLAGAVTLAPAVIGVGLVAMRGAPLLGAAGMALAVPGMLNPDGNPSDIIYLGSRAGVPVETVENMFDHLGDLPANGWFGFYAFSVAFGVGGLLLGVGLLVGRSVPLWTALVLILTPLISLVGSFAALGLVVSTLAWAMATAGFAGCAYSLVRP